MSGGVKRVGVGPLAQIKALEEDPVLSSLVAKHLPPNYDFEIAKTVWRIRRTAGCTTVALQFPEGLLIFASKVATVLREFTGVDALLMGDITYGACCVDDTTAALLGAQLLVHYGHSCLVPTSVASRIPTIYVFVTIKFSVEGAVDSIRGLLHSSELKTKTTLSKKIKVEEDGNEPLHVSLVSTIQFANSLLPIKSALEEEDGTRKVVVTIPRSKPLSSGEILGCTAPRVDDDVIVYVGDGRFHLEAMMMANPSIPAYRYDPYNRTLTEETFDHNALNVTRQRAVDSLMSSEKPLRIGVIQGTLGRQGNPVPVEHVYSQLEAKGHRPFVLLMSEVIPSKLSLMERDVDVWVQFACPRLSIDWGDAFTRPILTPYEAMWALRTLPPSSSTSSTSSSKCSCSSAHSCYEGHPMDYYAHNSLGPHTPNHVPPPKAPA